jgi:hypothetical protein
MGRIGEQAVLSPLAATRLSGRPVSVIVFARSRERLFFRGEAALVIGDARFLVGLDASTRIGFLPFVLMACVISNRRIGSFWLCHRSAPLSEA